MNSNRRLTQAFQKFLGVGLIGFMLDAAVFYTLQAFHFDIVTSRLASSLVACTLTWHLNRRWTFRTESTRRGYFPLGIEYLRYLGSSSVGAIANLGVVLLVVPYDAAFWHLPAYIIGTAAGLGVNFFLYSAIVFRPRRIV